MSDIPHLFTVSDMRDMAVHPGRYTKEDIARALLQAARRIEQLQRFEDAARPLYDAVVDIAKREADERVSGIRL